MNIQIFGLNKCFDTKKAQRYFKERNIKFQFIDLSQKSLSRGELNSVLSNFNSLEDLINEKSKYYEKSFIKYVAGDEAKIEKLLECGELFRTPVVRNGKAATIGYCPEIWKTWE
ncbi:MAG: ArsC family transcriptional regulator [Clostridia bacterium]|nr:ArsC family transcriptional regulator [Clostridia bacterium]